MRTSNFYVGTLLFTGLILSGFSSRALTVSDTAGTWRVLNFSMPRAFTLQRDGQGVVIGISEANGFENSTGSLNVLSNGTFSGSVPDPITGTVALGGQGELMVNVNDTGEGPESLTFHLNSTADVLATCRRGDDGTELILALRVPASLAPADLAGQWNVLGFKTPHHLVLERNAQNQVINIRGLSSFGTFGGALTVNTDATISGNIGGAFTGNVGTAGNGIVTVNINGQDGPESHTLFINAAKDVMALIESKFDTNDNQQEIMVFQKAPGANAVAELEGHWRIVTLDAPIVTQVSDLQGRVTGLGGSTSFGAYRQSLVTGYDGFFIARVPDPITGTITPSGAGHISINTPGSGEDPPESFNLQLNAGKTVLSSARSIGDGYELLFLTRSAPMAGSQRDYGLITRSDISGLTMSWAPSTNSALQVSSNMTSWQTVPGTSGQHSYTATPGGAGVNLYRVTQPAP
jgi:hypothetical protein